VYDPFKDFGGEGQSRNQSVVGNTPRITLALENWSNIGELPLSWNNTLGEGTVEHIREGGGNGCMKQCCEAHGWKCHQGLKQS